MSWELAELTDAVDAARILASAIETDQLGPDEDRRRAPRALSAILSLARARMHAVTRAIRGDLDPAEIHGPTNDAGGVDLDDDVVLVEWNAKRKGSR